MRSPSAKRQVTRLLIFVCASPLFAACGSPTTPITSPAESAALIEDEVYSPAKFAKAKSKPKTKAAGLKPVSLKQP